jgi:hypothetical protein
MCRPIWTLLLSALLAAGSAHAADGKVIKVLPQLLDLQGRHTKSPGLYERDAYQMYLRQHTNEISGIRFAVQWKAKGTAAAPMKLRVDLRGTAKGDLPTKATIEKEILPGGWFSHWAMLSLTGDNYLKLGEVTSWRATLWEGDLLLSEQQSFLW